MTLLMTRINTRPLSLPLLARHIKLEAELAEMNWRVRWDDILFGSPGKSKRLERQGSRMSLNRVGYS